jgi:hypothetical protein
MGRRRPPRRPPKHTPHVPALTQMQDGEDALRRGLRSLQGLPTQPKLTPRGRMQQKGHWRRWNGLGLDTKSRSTEAKTGRKQPRLAQGRSKEKAHGEREWQIPERRQRRLGQRRKVRRTRSQQRPIKNPQKGTPAEKSRQLRDIENIPAENSGHSADIGRRRDRGQRSRT